MCWCVVGRYQSCSWTHLDLPLVICCVSWYVSLFLHFGSWADSSIESLMPPKSKSRVKKTRSAAQDLAQKEQVAQKAASAASRKCATSGKENTTATLASGSAPTLVRHMRPRARPVVPAPDKGMSVCHRHS